jgi:hypothetical protein
MGTSGADMAPISKSSVMRFLVYGRSCVDFVILSLLFPRYGHKRRRV